MDFICSPESDCDAKSFLWVCCCSAAVSGGWGLATETDVMSSGKLRQPQPSVLRGTPHKILEGKMPKTSTKTPQTFMHHNQLGCRSARLQDSSKHAHMFLEVELTCSVVQQVHGAFKVTSGWIRRLIHFSVVVENRKSVLPNHESGLCCCSVFFTTWGRSRLLVKKTSGCLSVWSWVGWVLVLSGHLYGNVSGCCLVGFCLSTQGGLWCLKSESD